MSACPLTADGSRRKNELALCASGHPLRLLLHLARTGSCGELPPLTIAAFTQARDDRSRTSRPPDDPQNVTRLILVHCPK
jgi:hypothetical protein